MNRRSILAAYKKKSSHFQTGVTGFKSGNLFNYINRNAPAAAMFPVIPNHQANNVLLRFCACKEIFFADIQNPGYFLDSTLFGRSESRLILSNTVCRITNQVQSFS